MKEIKSNNIKICIIFDIEDINEGTFFLTENYDFLQVGVGCHKSDRIFLPHIHREVTRTTTKTQELIFVICGLLKVTIYDENENILETVLLKKNEGIIQFNGGHGFTVLKTYTKYIEVKNGPYLGIDQDRKRISIK